MSKLNSKIRVKKAFTLMEQLIVVALISTISLIYFTNFNVPTQKKVKVNLENVKEFMLKNFDFKKELSLVCFDSDNKLGCNIFVDEKMVSDIELNLFAEEPRVYEYGKELDDFIFQKVVIDDIEYDPFFKLTFNSDYKHKNLVVELGSDEVLVFSSINKKPKKYESTNEFIDSFYDKQIEVRDAF